MSQPAGVGANLDQFARSDRPSNKFEQVVGRRARCRGRWQLLTADGSTHIELVPVGDAVAVGVAVEGVVRVEWAVRVWEAAGACLRLEQAEAVTKSPQKTPLARGTRHVHSIPGTPAA